MPIQPILPGERTLEPVGGTPMAGVGALERVLFADVLADVVGAAEGARTILPGAGVEVDLGLLLLLLLEELGLGVEEGVGEGGGLGFCGVKDGVVDVGVGVGVGVVGVEKSVVRRHGAVLWFFPCLADGFWLIDRLSSAVRSILLTPSSKTEYESSQSSSVLSSSIQLKVLWPILSENSTHHEKSIYTIGGNVNSKLHDTPIDDTRFIVHHCACRLGDLNGFVWVYVRNVCERGGSDFLSLFGKDGLCGRLRGDKGFVEFFVNVRWM